MAEAIDLDDQHEDIGKVVQFTFGGPLMTVIGLWTGRKPEMLECCYHKPTGFDTVTVARKALRFVECDHSIVQLGLDGDKLRCNDCGELVDKPAPGSFIFHKSGEEEAAYKHLYRAGKRVVIRKGCSMGVTEAPNQDSELLWGSYSAGLRRAARMVDERTESAEVQSTKPWHGDAPWIGVLRSLADKIRAEAEREISRIQHAELRRRRDDVLAGRNTSTHCGLCKGTIAECLQDAGCKGPA